MRKSQFQSQDENNLTQSLLSTQDELFASNLMDFSQIGPKNQLRKKSNYQATNRDPAKQLPKATASHDSTKESLTKLLSILNNDTSQDHNNPSVEQLAPKSAQTAFNFQNCNPEILRQVQKVSIQHYFDRHLRKSIGDLQRKDLFKKMTMVSHRSRSMSQTLTILSKKQAIGAISLYQMLLRIGESVELQNILALLQKFIGLYNSQSDLTKRQLLLKAFLLTNHAESLFSIRMYQLLVAVVHTFTIEQEICLFLLAVIKKRLRCCDTRLNEGGYLRFLAFYLCRKLEGKGKPIQYQPLRNQLACLIFLRKIQIPCYLPAGRHVLVHAESFETFSDIKARAIECFGIGAHQKWLQSLQFIAFFQEKSNIIQEAIDESCLCWDWLSETHYMKQQFLIIKKEVNISLMFKLTFPIKFHAGDKEAIQILFANYYLEFRLDKKKSQQVKMLQLIALINSIKYEHSSRLKFPTRYQQLSQGESFNAKVSDWRQHFSQLDKTSQKQRFIEILNEDEAGLGLTAFTSLNFQVRVTRNQMTYIGDGGITLKVIDLNTIKSWEVEGQFLTLHFLDPSIRGQVIISEQANTIASYLQRRIFLLDQGYL